jgi:Polysaccharide lyase
LRIQSSPTRVWAVALVAAALAALVAASWAAPADAKRKTSTKIKHGGPTEVKGKVKRASKGRAKVRIKQAGTGVVTKDKVRVRGGKFELDYAALAPGRYKARARYLGSRRHRPSASKSRPFDVAPGGCALPDPDQVQGLASFELPGCPVVASDTGAVADASQTWGTIDCGKTTAVDASRADQVSTGGDPLPRADGSPQNDGAYRRLTTFDGDDHWGERCELGRHDHRYGSGGGDGTFQLYNEGERRVTMVSLRFPDNFSLETPLWQTVLQMKQTAPSAGSGEGPQIEVQVREGKFWLGNAHTDLWQAAAPQADVWTRLAFDVRYSQNPDVGFIKMYVDSNGDGDAADEGERSPTFHTATLKTEPAGGSGGDGIAPGEPIPSALRTGVYHNPEIACPAPDGCSVDVDNVQVLAAG